jgi:hypothetical protein
MFAERPMRSSWPGGVKSAMPVWPPGIFSSIQRMPGAHGLIGNDLESHLLGPERERAVLVAHGDETNFNSLDHARNKIALAHDARA